MEAGASLVADPFHVTKLANTKLDECPCRVQNATLGHRGRESDPLSLPAPFDQGQRAGSTTKATITSSPASFVPAISIANTATLWQAKEALRALCTRRSDLALGWVTQPGNGLKEKDYAIEARSLGPTRSGSRPARSDQLAPLETPDCRRGPGPRLPRTHRSGQQLHRAGQARRVGFMSFWN